MQESISEENYEILQNSTLDLMIPLFIFCYYLVINVARILQENNNKLESTSSQRQEFKKNYILEDDPECGIRMGGSDECFWDCDYFDINFVNFGIDFTERLFKDPLCMKA